MAKKMNIPVAGGDRDAKVRATGLALGTAADIEKLKENFAGIKAAIQGDLKYAVASDNEIKNFLDSASGSKFDAMVSVLERYGGCMKQCDDIMAQVDEETQEGFFNEVSQFALIIERNYNALVNYFAGLSVDEKLSFLGIEKKTAKVDEVKVFMQRINQMEQLSDKQKNILIGDLNHLLTTFGLSYDQAKEKSMGSAFGSAVLMVVIMYLFVKLVTWILPNWLGVILWGGYIYMIFKKYGQLMSVAKTRGESGGLKLFLAAVSLSGDD